MKFLVMLKSINVHKTIYLVFIKKWWTKYFSFPVRLPSTISSQFLWFNKDINFNGKYISFRNFSKKGLKCVGKLFKLERKLENWRTIKNKYHLLLFESFHWVQLVGALKTAWKQFIREPNINLNDSNLYDYYLVKKMFILLINLIARKYIIFSFFGNFLRFYLNPQVLIGKILSVTI